MERLHKTYRTIYQIIWIFKENANHQHKFDIWNTVLTTLQIMFRIVSNFFHFFKTLIFNFDLTFCIISYRTIYYVFHFVSKRNETKWYEKIRNSLPVEIPNADSDWDSARNEGSRPRWFLCVLVHVEFIGPVRGF